MASLLVRVSPQIQITFRRAFATTPPPEVLSQSQSAPSESLDTEHANHSSSAELKIKIDARAKSQANTKAKAKAKAQVQADPEADMNPLTLLLRGHKKQRLAIATVIVAAVGADVTFTYFTFFHGRKEGEAIRTDTVLDALAQMISEEGLSPMEK
ncbi:hypothetical protein EDD21DRAFT_380333 [Dissophora ornata]|nr:hypothetical protein BGZ58_010834 [Dissophora ornata]KAI8599258.1 hypothetical protein EDD21DRAFT_380333 [Dissophora ornata]